MSQDELKKALQTARFAHERETELTYTITGFGALLRAVELLADRQDKPSEADSGIVAKLEQKIKMQHARICELEAQDHRVGELLAKTHAAHVAAEAHGYERRAFLLPWMKRSEYLRAYDIEIRRGKWRTRRERGRQKRKDRAFAKWLPMAATTCAKAMLHFGAPS